MLSLRVSVPKGHSSNKGEKRGKIGTVQIRPRKTTVQIDSGMKYPRSTAIEKKPRRYE